MENNNENQNNRRVDLEFDGSTSRRTRNKYSIKNKKS